VPKYIVTITDEYEDTSEEVAGDWSGDDSKLVLNSKASVMQTMKAWAENKPEALGKLRVYELVQVRLA